MNTIQIQLKTILFILAFAICSWILIHVVTVFGVFLAIAYPIWWIFSPKQVICFFCRSRNESEFCPFCRKTVIKNDGNSPKTFLSASLNGLMILALTILSAVLVFAESLLLGAFGFPPPSKTVSISIPTTGEHVVREIFPMNITISGIKTPINTVRTDIRFDPQTLEVVDISTTNSFANIFIRKDIDNKGGFARLSGGLPNPGYPETTGLFATFYLRGLKPGITTVKFLPSSVVLANNGRGDNVLKELGSISYLILPNGTVTTNKNQTPENANLKVLGTSTSSATQMNFYDTSQVLGASTIPDDIQQVQSVNTVNDALTMLGRIDIAIVTLISKVL